MQPQGISMLEPERMPSDKRPHISGFPWHEAGVIVQLTILSYTMCTTYNHVIAQGVVGQDNDRRNMCNLLPPVVEHHSNICY